MLIPRNLYTADAIATHEAKSHRSPVIEDSSPVLASLSDYRQREQQDRQAVVHTDKPITLKESIEQWAIANITHNQLYIQDLID
jgi:hypothetical protein